MSPVLLCWKEKNNLLDKKREQGRFWFFFAVFVLPEALPVFSLFLFFLLGGGAQLIKSQTGS